MKIKYADFALLMMRVGFGLSMAINHGYGKMMGGPEKWAKTGNAMPNFDVTAIAIFWGFLAAFAEFGGALLVAAGFLTRGAAFMVAFTMLVAFYKHMNGGDGFNEASHSFELMIAFTAILLMGAGKYSIDGRVKVWKLVQ